MNWQDYIIRQTKKKKCLDLCNEMVLWFSEGKYVMKALDLKLRLGSPDRCGKGEI